MDRMLAVDNTDKPMVLRAAMKAVIVNKAGKVLLLRESHTYKEGTNTGRYHMPGGRVEPGEHFLAALKREVFEETGMTVTVDYPVYVGEWRPVIQGVPTQIIATFFVCSPHSEAVTLSEEHDHYVWLDSNDLQSIDIMGPESEVIRTYERFIKAGADLRGAMIIPN